MKNNTINDDTTNTDMDFFFWLGQDGLEPMTHQEFQSKVKTFRKILNDYHNCPKPD